MGGVGRTPLGSVLVAVAVVLVAVAVVALVVGLLAARVLGEDSSWSTTDDASTLVELGGVGGGRFRASR